jgi:hypothetical protein
MGHLRAYHAAVGGKRHGNRGLAGALALTRNLILAVATLLVACIASSAGHAQSGPFAGLAGNWSGGGTVSLDDGSSERIRCRATYAVSSNGAGLNQSLTCASDSYKFNLSSNLTSSGSSVSGTWSESSRGISGILQGHGSGGNLQVVASTAGFNANISLRTTGNKQSVVIRADSAFKGASISLSRS